MTVASIFNGSKNCYFKCGNFVVRKSTRFFFAGGSWVRDLEGHAGALHFKFFSMSSQNVKQKLGVVSFIEGVCEKENILFRHKDGKFKAECSVIVRLSFWTLKHVIDDWGLDSTYDWLFGIYVCLLRSSDDNFLICYKIICVFLARK